MESAQRQVWPQIFNDKSESEASRLTWHFQARMWKRKRFLYNKDALHSGRIRITVFSWKKI